MVAEETATLWTFGDSLVYNTNRLIQYKDNEEEEGCQFSLEVAIEEDLTPCLKKARTFSYQPSSEPTTLPTLQPTNTYIPQEEHELVDTEQSWISSLLDSDRNLLGTIELSFVDEDEESLVIDTLPEELIVRESYNIALWQFLRVDPSTPLCFVKFVEADGAGAKFRSGLWQSRQSAVIELPNGWEAHLVAESADADQPLTGYLCPAHLPLLLAQREMDTLLESRKLAAAIDIDDTLVKSIHPDEVSNYPPERVKVLKNMPVVIALGSYTEDFLRRAAKKFKLCLYSLGTQDYVREVAEALDPHHKLLDWDSVTSGISSARHEHDEGKEFSPKRLERVFSFANDEDGEVDYTMCLAVDDNPSAWAVKCRKKVLRVTSGVDSTGEWDSNLQEILHKMKKRHRKFYRKYSGDNKSVQQDGHVNNNTSEDETLHPDLVSDDSNSSWDEDNKPTSTM
jgi:hypothetical protein